MCVNSWYITKRRHPSLKYYELYGRRPHCIKKPHKSCSASCSSWLCDTNCRCNMYMCIFDLRYITKLPLSKVRTTSFSGSDAGCFSKVLGRDDALFQKKATHASRTLLSRRMLCPHESCATFQRIVSQHAC